MNSVFVYGTLKKGYGNHYILQNSKFCGNAVTIEKYLFLELGIPFLTKNQKHKKRTYVFGEVYNVNNEILTNLDDLEGHPTFYKREPIWVKIHNKYKYVFTYFISNDYYNENNCYINSSGIYENGSNL